MDDGGSVNGIVRIANASAAEARLIADSCWVRLGWFAVIRRDASG